VIGRAERAEIGLAIGVTRTRGHLATSRLLTEAKTRSTDARDEAIERLLALGRERVLAVELIDEDGQEVLVVDLARPARGRMACSGCGERARAAYDRRVVSWRHLDLARTRCVLRCEIRRVECPECGVRNEQVPWARAGSRFTRSFEDTCVFLARAAPKSVVAELQRIDWARLVA